MSFYDQIIGRSLEADRWRGFGAQPPAPSHTDKFAAAVVAIAAVLGVVNAGPDWLRGTANWISYLLPAALLLLLWRTITPYYQRRKAKRQEQAEEQQRALARQRAAKAMERIIALLRERLSNTDRYSSIVGLVSRISMNTAGERRIAVNARKESVSELCDVLNQLRDEIKPGEADLTARIIEHCVQRAITRLPALINVMAEPQTMEDCERLRGLTNDFINAYNSGVERVADAGLELLRPIPHHQMLHAPIKPSLQ